MGIGPGDVGDEFDEIDEEEEDKTDFQTVYDTITVPSEASLVIRTVGNQELTIDVDGDDVRLLLRAPDDRDTAEEPERAMVVPRSALVEAMVRIGLVRHGDMPEA